jgi:hypothetical protein
MAFPRSADSTPVLIEKKIAALRARLRAPTLALGGEDIGAPGYGREIRSITYRPRWMLSRRPERLKATRPVTERVAQKSCGEKYFGPSAAVNCRRPGLLHFQNGGWKRR